jgi:hypothetical protein
LASTTQSTAEELLSATTILFRFKVLWQTYEQLKALRRTLNSLALSAQQQIPAFAIQDYSIYVYLLFY